MDPRYQKEKPVWDVAQQESCIKHRHMSLHRQELMSKEINVGKEKDSSSYRKKKS